MRSQRGVVWPYLLLSVALLGALGFGVFQTRQRNQLAQESENKYMSAFHQLKWTSENIEERTSRLMATNDPHLQEGLLADLRVYSAQAVDHMAVLPFLTVNTPRMENYLNTLRDQADLMHEKLNQGGTLTADDWNKLSDIRRQSVAFESELGNLMGIVGNGMIRWRDTVRVTGPAQTGAAVTPITRSVVHLEQALTPPPGQEGAMSPQAGPLAKPRLDPGPRVDQAAAIAAVKRFVDMPLNGEPKITGNSDPADQAHTFSLYFIDAQKANGTALNFGVSIHGGHVIYMLDGRPVTDKRFTVSQLVDRARQMLRQRGYTTAEYVSAVENDGTLVMDFAPMEQGVAVHVDRIKIALAMDNGELVGFDAKNYWINRHARTFSKPAISAADAVKRVAPRLKVQDGARLALIADRRFQEKLAWEVRGAIDNQQYRIFIDAQTGQELDVQREAGDPAPPMNKG